MAIFFFSSSLNFGKPLAYIRPVMGRRRRDDPTEALLSIGGAFLLLWLFVPAFHIFVFVAVGLLFLALTGFIIYRIATHENRLANIHPDSGPSAPSTPAPVQSLSDKLRAIDWFQFEKLVAAIYRAKGFSVVRRGGAKPDGGVDLVIEKDGTKSIVQCKHWKSWNVKERDIREFLGALTHAKISNGIFITLKGYTAGAKTLAAEYKFQLIGEFELVGLLDSVDWRYNPDIISALDDSKKLCPKCERALTLRTATKGKNSGNQFWGCSGFPVCRYILRTP